MDKFDAFVTAVLLVLSIEIIIYSSLNVNAWSENATLPNAFLIGVIFGVFLAVLIWCTIRAWRE